MSIRAIGTQYKGYRFRSRLEARWAVFFDTLGLEWEYEHEGFELSDGQKYLPDFYLPAMKLYAEVKPNSEKYDEDRCLLHRFVLDMLSAGTPVGVVPCIGIPSVDIRHDYTIVALGPTKREGVVYSNCEIMNIQYNDYFKWTDNKPLMVAAVKAARSARFEFGETGF